MWRKILPTPSTDDMILPIRMKKTAYEMEDENEIERINEMKVEDDKVEKLRIYLKKFMSTTLFGRIYMFVLIVLR